MGKIIALIGGLIMIFVHTIQYVSISFAGNDLSVFSIVGFLFIWLRTSSTVAGTTTSETDTERMGYDWLKDGGSYDSFYGMAIFGIIIFIFIIMAIVFTFTKKDSPASGWLFITAAALLLIVRFLDLNNNETFFFQNKEDFTYIEIPLGFIAGLLAGIVNLKSS